MTKSLLAGAFALATLPLSLGFMTRKALAQGPITPEQLTALNFALRLERLEAAFYGQGLASSLDFAETRPIFEQISKHEAAHVLVLETLLASNAQPPPTFDFGSAFSSLDTFVTMAQGFEDVGVRAYKGQVETLATSAELLSLALRIHSVEARHAAWIRRLAGITPAADAFDEPRSKRSTLAIVDDTHFVVRTRSRRKPKFTG